MELHLAEQQRTAGATVEPLEQLLERGMSELSEFLGRFTSVGVFRHFDWTEDGVEMLQPPHFGPAQYAHLRMYGFEGSIVEYSPGDPIFNQWELLAGLLGNVVRGGRLAASSRL